MESTARREEKLIHFTRTRNGQQEEARLSVTVPAGVRDKQRLKLRGEGGEGLNGGPRGDLYIEINLLPHPLFTRQEQDVCMDLPISFVDAIRGADVEIPTLMGRVKLKIAQGSHTGQVLRLRKKGFPAIGKHPQGDMLVRLIVDIPKKMTKSELALVEKLSEVAKNTPMVEAFKKKVGEIYRSRKV